MLNLHTHLCNIRSHGKASVFDNTVPVRGRASWEALGSIFNTKKSKKERAEERSMKEGTEKDCLRTFSLRRLHLKIALVQGRQMTLELKLLRLLQRTGFQFSPAGQNCL